MQVQASNLPSDSEYLVGLSVDELNALVSCKLALTEQDRLDGLLARNARSSLSEQEMAELDELLVKVDQLTILKTCARYTLSHESVKQGRIWSLREYK
jgi:hypothetical protein